MQHDFFLDRPPPRKFSAATRGVRGGVSLSLSRSLYNSLSRPPARRGQSERSVRSDRRVESGRKRRTGARVFRIIETRHSGRPATYGCVARGERRHRRRTPSGTFHQKPADGLRRIKKKIRFSAYDDRQRRGPVVVIPVRSCTQCT